MQKKLNSKHFDAVVKGRIMGVASSFLCDLIL